MNVQDDTLLSDYIIDVIKELIWTIPKNF
jgi:hypothetical protein